MCFFLWKRPSLRTSARQMLYPEYGKSSIGSVVIASVLQRRLSKHGTRTKRCLRTSTEKVRLTLNQLPGDSVWRVDSLSLSGFVFCGCKTGSTALLVPGQVVRASDGPLRLCPRFCGGARGIREVHAGVHEGDAGRT